MSSGTATKGLLDSEAVSAYDMIQTGRKQLMEILGKDLNFLVNELISKSVITKEACEVMKQMENDSKKQSNILLIHIKNEGEETCGQFLECLERLHPGSIQALKCSDNESLLREKKVDSPKLEVKAKTEVPKEDDLLKENVDSQRVPVERNKVVLQESKKALEDMLAKLDLQKCKSKKLSLQEVLEISSGSLKLRTPRSHGDLPWFFLRKVLAGNVMARNTSLEQEELEDQETEGKEEQKYMDETVFFTTETLMRMSVNPLDVLCAVLLCSDSFLQQEIFSKMSLCQFALPLVLPPLETPKCTLMLWPMRDIVKKWRPHSLAESRGFREENLVLTPMPTISFVRMGNLRFSKSSLLNLLLSPSQQYHNFFIHQDMECGNIPREIADGLVEMAWYFPRGVKNLDLFPEPVAVLNLRGDAGKYWEQFSFLTQVSSAMFILAETITETEYALLSRLKKSSTQYYFILGNPNQKTFDFLNKLAPRLESQPEIRQMKSASSSAEFVGKLRFMVKKIINSDSKKMAIHEMAQVAHEHAIRVDEDSPECQKAYQYAEQITRSIEDVALYKKQMLKLQGDLWKELAKVEKEFCRLERQGSVPLEEYKAQLKQKLLELRRQQHKCELSQGLTDFLKGITTLKSAEKHHFLKWMKFKLDRIARSSLSNVRATYKEKSSRTSGNDGQTIIELDQVIASSSLGIEHFMRELGQFYEAEYSMVKDGKIPETKRQFNHFPSIAADLMLEGFPLELIDGDASNIPLQWITDVLTQLHNKLEGRSKMRVVTVLGVQSTGKSTLLNTMFGLQFAVSSGRCTRGAFMLLLRVREDLAQEIGCDFILVIDTEGLKAPELAKLEDSYQHDNELATLVIGLSDITIVNMAMENAAEMKDVLQIVTHAFLRMESVNQKPNCHFVHQNVSDVSAHDQNMRDRKHLLDQLNEMTMAAAKMEKIDKEVKFSDIMDYNPETNNWYIPGLWYGVSPMAPVNIGYSEKVYELKKSLFEFIRSHAIERPPKDIPQFTEWVKSLWNAVKYETFIFSFRNSLIAEAYTNLSTRYSEWEWNFRREMHLWVSEQETLIQNISPDQVDHASWQSDLQAKLSVGEKQILENLKQFFESRAANLHLIEKYKEDFARSAVSLKHELESYCYNKCKEAIRIAKCRYKIDTLEMEYLKIINRKVDQLLGKCREANDRLEDEELKREFEKMWNETLLEISPGHLAKQDIPADIDLYLKREFTQRGGSVKMKWQEAETLLNYRIHTFHMKSEYINASRLKRFKRNNLHKLAEEFALSLMAKCQSYIKEKVKTKGDYDETYCGELLRMINKNLQQPDVQKLYTTSSFEVDLKLHILGEAAHAFQKMQEKFVTENDPLVRLEKLKPHYFSTFRDLYLEKDAQLITAKVFCQQCLYYAIIDYVSKRLGTEIVNDILNSSQSISYFSRTSFQFTLLKELLEEGSFAQYIQYISSYEEFVKSWIYKQTTNHYTENKNLMSLEKEIVSGVLQKVHDTLEKVKCKDPKTVSEFCDIFCQEIQKELVISKHGLMGIQFKNAFSLHQFSAYVEDFLPDLQVNILDDLHILDMETKFLQLTLKPQDEIFRRVFGCGKQCPFCKVPCEAGGSAHMEHFAAVHQPQGLGLYKDVDSEKLTYNLCSTLVASESEFQSEITNWEWHRYKDYRVYYPDWCIQPDPTINASDYWKYVLKEFNDDFAQHYQCKPADVPEDWKTITKEQALQALKETYNMKAV